MEKSKNKQFDKENILVERTASEQQVLQTATLSLSKKDENSGPTDPSHENNENKTVPNGKVEISEVQIQNEMIICKENNS